MIPRCWYVLAFLAFVPSAAFAEGLLYQLPKDGCWVQFKMDGFAEEPGGKVTTMKGDLTMSSVGTTEIEGKQCRWIEIATKAKRNGEAYTLIEKLLIPEEHLAKGKSPLDHIAKAWRQHSQLGDMPKQIDVSGGAEGYIKSGNIAGPFLHGPFKSENELDAVRIDSKLGELECKGISAFEKIEQQSGVTLESNFTIRLHENSPFGVISWVSEVNVQRPGQFLGTMKLELKLVDAGTNAKSAIPDAN